MAKRDSKTAQLLESLRELKGQSIDPISLEEHLRDYCNRTGNKVKGYGSDLDDHDIRSGADYTKKLYRDKKSGLSDFMEYDRKTGTYYVYDYDDAERGDKGYWPGWIDNYIKDPIRGVTNTIGSSRRGGFDLKGFIFSPLGLVLLVIAVCVILYELVGPAVYNFIMNGPFFKILLIILAIAAVMAVLRSARGWPGGIKFVVLLVIGLVLLYSVVGPAVYSFLMSGALFKILCLVIAGAAVIGIIKADLGWPIGVKIAVIAVIWLVLKSEVL